MHKFKRYVTTDDQHYARCSCGVSTGYQENLQQVEDAEMRHSEEVERIRTHLGTQSPSLQSQRNYYAEKAEDHRETEENRRLWKQLADELDHRLGSTPEEETLPGLDGLKNGAG